MNRPDFSEYVAHFTKSDPPFVDNDYNVGMTYKPMSAEARLINILREEKISATLMPWTNVPAVCFTECPWMSLLSHTQRYSSYGIGFSKKFLFSKHGGPALYVRGDHFEEQRGQWEKHLFPFVTRFWPSYRPKSSDEKVVNRTDCDYSHEREWRVPHDFSFDYKHIEFIILPDYKAMAAFPQELKDGIGREKFILMDNYMLIERLWPVHRI